MVAQNKSAPASIDLGNLGGKSNEELLQIIEAQRKQNEALAANQRNVLNGDPTAKVKKAEPTIDPTTKQPVLNKDGTPRMTGGKLSIYGVASAKFPLTLRDGRQIERLFDPKNVLKFIEVGISQFDNFNFESQAATPEERVKEMADAKAHTKEVLTRLRKVYQAAVAASK